jgi:hypothetical protein
VTAALLGAAPAAWPGGALAASGSFPGGTQLWVSRFNGSDADAQATAITISPAGRMVFVTGLSRTGPHTRGWVTIAYNPKTGTTWWLTAKAAGNGTTPRAISVSPDSTRVFVTGTQPGIPHGFMTAAYDAATGTQQWVTRYDGKAHSTDQAAGVAIIPDGKTVLVTAGAWAGTRAPTPRQSPTSPRPARRNGLAATTAPRTEAISARSSR